MKSSPIEALDDTGVMTPKPYQPARPQYSFARGRDKPRGVKWFGAQSFWGHLRHLAATAIATEDVDSRSWMTPDDPRSLLSRVCRVLGAPGQGNSVTEALGRDLWLDYVADTGDDAAVSRAVAKLLFAPYRVPDPTREGDWLVAPRGDVLLFGGDTAYPVATAEEITNRVLVPFNQVLKERNDDAPRVLIGIPGNHDWYDGLDGFARMFRHRVAPEGQSHAPTSRQSKTLIGRYATYAREFARGGQIEKPEFLDLLGYTPVQNASHFILPLAPGLTMLAVDRQLRRLDHRQREYFERYLNSHLSITPWVVLPDPLYAFGRESESGFDMLRSLGLRLHRRAQFFLSGDIHHYRRERMGGSLLVTAGGGGAFLHPAPLVPSPLSADVEFPNVDQSRALLWQVPWKIARGRSGILPHWVLLAMLLPAFTAAVTERDFGRSMVVWALPSIVVLTLVLHVMVGPTTGSAKTLFLAFSSAILIVGLGLSVARFVPPLLDPSLGLGYFFALIGAVAATVFAAVFVFGLYLAALTRFGLQSTQAFTALDHPGFKHFVRFRIRADGSGVDAFCVGLVDPLSPSSTPVLVDRFTFHANTEPHRQAPTST